MSDQDTERDSLPRFTPGHQAYSKTYGPCVYIVTAERHANNRDSMCRIHILCSKNDDDYRDALRHDLQKRPSKTDIVDMIEIMRGSRYTMALPTLDEVPACLTSGDFKKIALLTATLHKIITRSNAVKIDKPLADSYAAALDRATAIITAYAITKQHSPGGGPLQRQPSHLALYFAEIRSRVELTLNGGLPAHHIETLFKFDGRAKGFFAKVAVELTANSRSAVVTTQPAIAADDPQRPSHPEIILPAPEQKNAEPPLTTPSEENATTQEKHAHHSNGAATNPPTTPLTEAALPAFAMPYRPPAHWYPRHPADNRPEPNQR